MKGNTVLLLEELLVPNQVIINPQLESSTRCVYKLVRALKARHGVPYHRQIKSNVSIRSFQRNRVLTESFIEQKEGTQSQTLPYWLLCVFVL